MLGRVLSKRLACDIACEGAFKRWYELEMHEKQRFVNGFVALYREQYPVSRSNGSLQGLSAKMNDHHRDSPSVFGIFYNDIWGRRCRRFQDPSFQSLLIPR
ncbi:Mlo1p TDEL_0B00940 [Torulaspora delbrueckii]|uniref:Uncharacterized protein n=1 Tax=Torulaspora delbrueckii TaxID=4950 RepID=G8ZNM9_TORDE|nr:hypothetical protein TDEL_0B00940 [Torulaspora delbrueckii]CCE90223.1 hypothetical protein TDEL_0B00940 [Torulaspora delbrueckii]